MGTVGGVQRTGQIVFTNKARCRDCYRCLRACPVKAIRVVDGQAFVDPDRCIACGTCIRECPQGAKSFRNDVERAVQLLAEGAPVAASVAPSFVAYFPVGRRERLPEALRRLGFARVSETAVGAYAVARATADIAARNGSASHICSACPAAVRYIEQYEPDLASRLVPVVSPMMAHARRLKAELGPGARVVFIGPCVAKKAEAEREELAGTVDCVLTFPELMEWLARAEVDLDACDPGPFDDAPAGDARYFPVPGGLARTGRLTTDLLATDCLAVSGIEDIREALENLREGGAAVVEPLFCPQGCVNGPGMTARSSIYRRRGEVIDYAATHEGRAPDPRLDALDLWAEYGAADPSEPEFSEEEIQAVLERTGKVNPEDQLNCGACGYDSCREKAVAVLRGMAVPDMCLPRMRRLAEQRSDRILETSPNGVVVLDEHLRVLHMNGAFRRMFQCTDGVLGKRISYLMDPEPFERLARDGDGPLEFTARHEKYSLVCHQVVYALPEVEQYVGIFVNITNSLSTQEKLKRLRSETLRKAEELMEHQVQAAQEMARFLGESTARSEELLRNIQSMASDKLKLPGDNWLWDTGTSK